MAKNLYKNTVKELLTADRLFLQKAGDSVYLSDGHIIVAVDRYAYEVYFRPSSGVFIELDEGAAYTGIKGAIPTVGHGADLVKLYNLYVSDAPAQVSGSPFLMEYTDGKKKKHIRMMAGQGYYVQIKEGYYQIALEIGLENFRNKGNSKSPVIAVSGNYGIVILPMIVNQSCIDDFINTVK